MVQGSQLFCANTEFPCLSQHCRIDGSSTSLYHIIFELKIKVDSLFFSGVESKSAGSIITQKSPTSKWQGSPGVEAYEARIKHSYIDAQKHVDGLRNTDSGIVG